MSRDALLKTALIYSGVLVVMLSIAKYPALLAGEWPKIGKRELGMTLLLAGVGTALLLRLRDWKND